MAVNFHVIRCEALHAVDGILAMSSVFRFVQSILILLTDDVERATERCSLIDTWRFELCKDTTTMDIRWKLPSLLLIGSLAVGCGDTADTAPSANSTVAAPAATTTTAAPAAVQTQVAAKPIDPLLAGLEFDDPEEFPKARSTYEANRSDVGAVEDYAGILLGVAYAHAQGGNAELSNKALSLGGEVIMTALQNNVAIKTLNSDEKNAVPAELLYGYACVLSRNDQAAKSLDVLNKAISVGFANEQVLNSDTDLAAVRELPEYAAAKESWTAHFEGLKQKYKEGLIAKAKEDLNAQKPFDFDFALTNVDGTPIKLDDFKGQVRIVDIWGTWCPPCRNEVPIFVKLQDAYGKYGLQVIGLNDERGPSPEANIQTVKNFMANASVNYPCAIVTPEVVEQVPDFGGFPTTLIIDHTGKVRLKAFGFHEYEYFDTVVRQLLTEAAKSRATNTN